MSQSGFKIQNLIPPEHVIQDALYRPRQCSLFVWISYPVDKYLFHQALGSTLFEFEFEIFIVFTFKITNCDPLCEKQSCSRGE